MSVPSRAVGDIKSPDHRLTLTPIRENNPNGRRTVKPSPSVLNA